MHISVLVEEAQKVDVAYLHDSAKRVDTLT